MKNKIILLGDSITEVFPPDLIVFNDFIIINRGISGDNTEGVYKRLEKDVILESPLMVFVLIGTNDFAQGKKNSEIEENISKILTKLKISLNNAEIFAVSILPVRNIENRSNMRIIEVNNNIKRIAEETGVNYFNLFPHFVDESGRLKQEFTDDGLHLTSEAYKCWVKLMSDIIRDSI